MRNPKTLFAALAVLLGLGVGCAKKDDSAQAPAAQPGSSPSSQPSEEGTTDGGVAVAPMPRESAAGPMPKPAVTPEVKPKPEVKPGPEPKPEIKPEPEPEPKPEVEPKPVAPGAVVAPAPREAKSKAPQSGEKPN